METKTLLIPGKPVAKGRPRFSGRGKFVRTYTPKKTADAEETVRRAWISEHGNFCFAEGIPIFIEALFSFEPPKGTPKKDREEMISGKVMRTKKPDLDNLVKLVLDALNGTAFADDSQVTGVYAAKRYAEEESTWVSIAEAYPKEENDG